jgi:uncharacterized protein YndB with AHSA1/START domain
MIAAEAIPPVQKSIEVQAPQERAFRVFTEQIDTWWPREHHIGKAPPARFVLEPSAGGRWYEVGTDGSECNTGKVLAWEPPRRLLLAWQITGAWQYDPSLVTEVEVTFTPLGPKRTRVDLVHRHMERFGEIAAATRKELDSPGGWGKTLESYARAAEA